MRRVILPAMLEKIKESVLLQGKLPRVRSQKFEETRAIGFHSPLKCARLKQMKHKGDDAVCALKIKG